jgi:excisionase family DNA binding protein
MKTKQTSARRPKRLPVVRKPKRLPVERATYTVDELAVLLGRGRISVYADLSSGRIPSRRLGNKYVISRAAIHRWLEDNDGASAA